MGKKKLDGFPKLIKKPFQGEEIVVAIDGTIFSAENKEIYTNLTDSKYALYCYKFDGYEFMNTLN